MKKIVLVLMALLLSAVSFGQIDVSPTTFHNGINLPNAVEDNAPDSLLTITGDGTVQYVLKSSIQADETDPIYSADPASGITQTDINNWNASETNVQSDWNAVNGDAFILNKPLIPTDNSQIANGAGYITNYSLPIASPTTLGGVKVGDGLSVDGSGILSSSGLKLITEGSNSGWTFSGLSRLNKEPIGDNAIDFTIYQNVVGEEGLVGASGRLSVAFGLDAYAGGNYSAAFGLNTKAVGDYSVSFGYENSTTRNYSAVFGKSNTVEGFGSVAFGRENVIKASNTLVAGDFLTVYSNTSVAFGTFNTYDPTPYNNSRVLTIGNGNSSLSRSDAFTILRNGQAALGIDNFEANTTGELLQVNGEVKATQYKLSTLNTAPTSSTDTGETGEIRITSNYIYVCIATNTWVRAALTTW